MRKRPAIVDGRLHMTWQVDTAVGKRPAWRWWPPDWYRIVVDAWDLPNVKSWPVD